LTRTGNLRRGISPNYDRFFDYYVDSRRGVIKLWTSLIGSGFKQTQGRVIFMNIRSLIPSLTAGIVLVSTAAFAGSGDFTGSFSGFYAPSSWDIVVSGNPLYQATAVVSAAGAPNNVTIIGAVGPSASLTSPFSVVDYSTTIQGATLGEPESVSFSYAFFNPSGVPNGAEVLDNGVLVATLPASGTEFVMPTGFVAGSTLEIQVTSGNTTLPDVLEIAPIPEPSTVALAGLGGAILLWQSRRKFGRS
jgi:hypothetical protein